MFKKYALALYLFFICTQVIATTIGNDESHIERSSQDHGVVVVLAGGGAKGFAHLAVLHRLEQDHVPVKKIIGTSMGAVIGGLYAGGLTVEQIKNIIQQVDPTTVALDQVSRQEQPNLIKEYQQRYPISLEIGLKEGAFSTASGLSDGQRFLALLQRELAFLPGNSDFDHLKIPFRAVATRLRDGEMTVFKEGNLPFVIRASMAAPTVFSPFDIEGETYVDGGLVGNIAIEVAKQENPNDIIVASFLGQKDLSKQVKINGPIEAANQMLDILVHQNEVRNLKLLSNRDILVTPKVADIQFADFNRADEVILRGRDAVAVKESQFEQLKMTEAIDAKDYDKKYPSRPLIAEVKPIHQIIIKGNSRIPEAYIRQNIHQEVNTAMDQKQLAVDIENLYTSGHVEGINYVLNDNADGTTDLQVNVIEKEYGPHFFKFGYGLYSNFGTINSYFLGAGYRHPWLNDSGLELRIDTRIGSERALEVSLIQPVTNQIDFAANLVYDSNYLPLYDQLAAKNADVIDYLINYKQTVGDVGFYYNFSKNTQAKFKIFRGKYGINYAIGLNLTGVSSIGSELVSGSQVQFTHDTLNSTTFPDSGTYFNLLLENGFNNSYRKTSGTAKWAFARGADIFNIGFEGGKISDGGSKTSSPTIFILGGFQSMGAYPYGKLLGDEYAHAETAYMRRLTDSIIGKSYAGVVLEYGGAWFASDVDQKWYKQLHPSATAFIGVDSKIGDLYLGYGKGALNQSTLFLQLGKRLSLF